MFKKILVPLDGSVLAESILPSVTALAKCTGAEIILLRVLVDRVSAYLPTEPIFAGPVSRRTEDPRRDALFEPRQRAEGYLQRIGWSLSAEGLNVSTEVVGGPVADTILDFAEGSHADVIAMSTHGRSGVARLMLGSVADLVVRRSPVPVLLVHPQPITLKVSESAEHIGLHVAAQAV